MSEEKYTIQAGDNWGNLAEKFGITPQELAALNQRDLEQPLDIGETITVPEERPLRIDIKHDLPAIAELNKKLLFDSQYRQRFLENPESVFESQGIPIPKELVPEDFPVLRLLDDEEFKSIAQSGDNIKTQEYLAKNYPQLARTRLEAAAMDEIDSVSDISHAIDVVAVVAVPVFVVADPIV